MTCITIHMEWEHNPQGMFSSDITICREWHHNPEGMFYSDITIHRVTSQSTMNVLQWHHNQKGVTSQQGMLYSDITIHVEWHHNPERMFYINITIHREWHHNPQGMFYSDITIHREWDHNAQGMFYNDIAIHAGSLTVTQTITLHSIRGVLQYHHSFHHTNSKVSKILGATALECTKKVSCTPRDQQKKNFKKITNKITTTTNDTGFLMKTMWQLTLLKFLWGKIRMNFNFNVKWKTEKRDRTETRSKTKDCHSVRSKCLFRRGRERKREMQVST